MKKSRQFQKNFIKPLLTFIIIGHQTACSTLLKVDKPNPEGIFNFTAGYCIGAKMNTLETRIITPDECTKIKNGDGVFYKSEELKKILAFGNKICDVTQMCKDDEQKAENDKFLEFLNKPDEFRKELLKKKE